MISVFRHGINNDNIGPIAKASFEETPEMFLRAARHAELDPMRGVSANVMCGQKGYFGTNAFQTILDIDKMRQELDKVQEYEEELNVEKYISDGFEMNNTNENCSTNNIKLINNIASLDSYDTGCIDDDYDPGF